MLSNLSSNDKLALVTAILVEMTALLALGDSWGMLMIVPLAASLGVIAIVLQPMLSPGMKLPAPKGISLLALGVAAVVGTAITTVQYVDFIADEIADPETLIFLFGLVVAVGMAYAGFVAFRAESGSAATAAPTTPAAPPAA